MLTCLSYRTLRPLPPACAGLGYYINTMLIMATISTQLFTLCFFALARANEVSIPSMEPPTNPSDPNSKPKEVITITDTLSAEYVLQLGTLSLLPFLCELALEHGLIKCLIVAVRQTIAGEDE